MGRGLEVVLGSGDASLRVLRPPARSVLKDRDQNRLGGRDESLAGDQKRAGGSK